MIQVELAQLKVELHKFCIEQLSEKKSEILSTLADLRESSANDKSAMGDKYETATEMAAVERENQLEQLQVVESHLASIKALNPSKKTESVCPGSLVRTNSHLFYLCTSMGKISLGENTVMAISSASPLGQKLIDCRVHDSVEQNGMTYTIVDLA